MAEKRHKAGLLRWSLKSAPGITKAVKVLFYSGLVLGFLGRFRQSIRSI